MIPTMPLVLLIQGAITGVAYGYFARNTAIQACAGAANCAVPSYWSVLGYGAAGMAIALAVGLLLFVIGIGLVRSEEAAAKRAKAARLRTLEALHPGCRATVLSNGHYMLTDKASGRAVGEYPIPPDCVI